MWPAMRYNRVGSGRLAQLGERHVRNVEVVGSIPTPSTNFQRPASKHFSGTTSRTHSDNQFALQFLAVRISSIRFIKTFVHSSRAASSTF